MKNVDSKLAVFTEHNKPVIKGSNCRQFLEVLFREFKVKVITSSHIKVVILNFPSTC